MRLMMGPGCMFHGFLHDQLQILRHHLNHNMMLGRLMDPLMERSRQSILSRRMLLIGSMKVRRVRHRRMILWWIRMAAADLAGDVELDVRQDDSHLAHRKSLQVQQWTTRSNQRMWVLHQVNCLQSCVNCSVKRRTRSPRIPIAPVRGRFAKGRNWGSNGGVEHHLLLPPGNTMSLGASCSDVAVTSQTLSVSKRRGIDSFHEPHWRSRAGGRTPGARTHPSQGWHLLYLRRCERSFAAKRAFPKKEVVGGFRIGWQDGSWDSQTIHQSLQTHWERFGVHRDQQWCNVWQWDQGESYLGKD